jgi:hypothetical protein
MAGLNFGGRSVWVKFGDGPEELNVLPGPHAARRREFWRGTG